MHESDSERYGQEFSVFIALGSLRHILHPISNLSADTTCNPSSTQRGSSHEIEQSSAPLIECRLRLLCSRRSSNARLCCAGLGRRVRKFTHILPHPSWKGRWNSGRAPAALLPPPRGKAGMGVARANARIRSTRSAHPHPGSPRRKGRERNGGGNSSPNTLPNS